MKRLRSFQAMSAAALVAAPLLGQAIESLAVVPVSVPPGPTPELIEMSSQLRTVIAGRNPGVLDSQQLRDRMTGQVAGATLGELDRAFGAARASYLSGDYEGSARTLRAIVEELDKLPDGEEAFSQWQRAMLRLARAESDLGQADASLATLDRLVRAAPQVQVDPTQNPPRFIRMVDEAKAQVKALPVHKLVVNSPAKGARVYVNGRDVGAAPITVSLPQGRYRVTGALGSTRTPPAKVDLLEGDATVMLDFTIPDSFRPGRGPGLALPEGDRASQIIAAGGYLRLDSILAASVVDEGGVPYLSGALYDVRRGMLTREGRVRMANQALPVGGTTALADFLITGQASSTLVEIPGVARAPDLSTPLPGKSADLGLSQGDKKPKNSALGWTAFGTGIATVGLAGVSVWQAIASSNDYSAAEALKVNNVVPPASQPQYNALIASGDSAKSTAVITGVAAGACAVGTVVMAVIAGQLGPIRF
jgi:exonuclease VII small subunit